MKRVLFATVLCFAFVSQGLAQGSPSDAPPTKEDVEKYLEVTHSHDMVLKMVNSMMQPMHQAVHEQYLRDKDKLPPDFEARTNKITDDMMRNMPFDQMIEAMIPAYQKHFTKGDLVNIVAFYSTPTGQKLLREAPALMSDSMQAMMPIMRQQMEAVNSRLKQEATTLAAPSSASPAAPPAKKPAPAPSNPQ
jgi:hypothetical protein